MTTLFTLLFGIIFFLVSLKRLNYGLFLILAGLPLYVVRFSAFGIPMTWLELMILLLFALFVYQNSKAITVSIRSKINKESNVKNRYPFDIEMVLVLIAAFMAMAVSGFENAAMGIWKAYFFEPLLVYILIFNIFFKSDGDNDFPLLSKIKKIILPLSISAFFVSVFAIYQKITGQYIPNELWAASETRRVTSFFGYPNAVGLFLGPIAMLMISFLFASRVYLQSKFEKNVSQSLSIFSMKWFEILPLKEKATLIFIKTSFILSLLAIYYAKSEGALIAIFASIILLLFLKDPFIKLGKIRVALIVFFFASIALIFSFGPLKNAFVEKITLDDFSGQVRKAQWQETGIMLRDGNWFLGAGLAGYKEKIKPYHKIGIYLKNDNDPDYEKLIKVSPEYQAKYWQPLEIFLYPHSIFLNFWVELGLLGMIVFIWIILKVFVNAFSCLLNESLIEKRMIVLGVITATFVLVVHGIVDVPYFKNDLSIIFWIIIAISGLLELEYKRKTP